MNNWQAVGALFGVQTGGFSGVGGNMALGGGDPITQYRTAQSMKDRQMEMVRQDPMVKRDIAEFDKALENAETPEDLLKNRRSMEFLLRGLGMADQIGNDALIRKSLLEDPTKQDALVNRLQDKRYKEGAEMFRFAELGLEAVRNEEFKTKFTESYVQQRYEEKLAETNPAIPDAMAFERIVKDSKKDLTNPYNVLGDPLLRRVVTTALDLPKQIAVQSVEAQARAVTTRMDLNDLKDPDYVDKFVQRFLMNDTRGGQQGGMGGLGGGGGNGAWQTNLLSGLSGGGGGGFGGGGFGGGGSGILV
ncbi:DUF1217 domain-containing protein [Fodinicurvata fenggangensis]|uniref:DUF1217 domain-containing protein n=1 Tax=Fodinicurvata fenggangensis TaxID=1121830 RepID=UPI00047BB247|nr:DUF1217 domain-containing protein [Fodinicurvata fenggangensis]